MSTTKFHRQTSDYEIDRVRSRTSKLARRNCVGRQLVRTRQQDCARHLLPGPSCRWTSTMRLRRRCCANLSLVILIAITLAAHTFALETNQPRRPEQQVDARLIPKTPDNGQTGELAEIVRWNISQFESAPVEGAEITKRISTTSTPHDLAEHLQAELRFGDLDESQPREQSRLAKLCQQTSSVLASVLPAPFGGHKRSILCQFFGQVQVGNGGGRGANKRTIPPAASYPINGVNLTPEVQFGSQAGQLPPVSGFKEPESVAILHQINQPPVAISAIGKHPIQMVLEHQQRLAAFAQASQQPKQLPVIINRAQVLPQSAQQQSGQYQVQQPVQKQVASSSATQKPERASPVKFSSPLSLITSSAATATSGQPAGSNASGWRVFNVSLFATDPNEPNSHSPTTPMPVQSTNVTETSTERLKTLSPSFKRRPPQRAIQVKIDRKPSELSVAESRQTAESLVDVVGSDGVRTIDVIAQSAPLAINSLSTNITTNATNVQTLGQTQVDKVEQKKASSVARPDSVQRREELVIASINNLTRIAFGSNLRDTVKVINRLIDQQADLFKQPEMLHSKAADSMQVSESIVSKSQLASPVANSLHTPEKSKLRGSKLELVETSTDGAKRLRKPQAQSETKSGSRQQARAHLQEARRVTPSGDQSSKKTKEQTVLITTRRNRGESRTTPTATSKAMTNYSKRTKPSGGPSTSASNLELRRLTTIGRSLLHQHQTGQFESTTPKPRSLSSRSAGSRLHSKELASRTQDDFDLTPAQSIADLRRDFKITQTVASGWVPSGGPRTTKTATASGRHSMGDKSNAPTMRKLRDEFARSTIRTRPTNSLVDKPTNSPTTSGTSPLVAASSAGSATVAQFPWLLPDKSSVAESDLFSSSSSSSSVSAASSFAKPEIRTTISEAPEKWTTRRMIAFSGLEPVSLSPAKVSGADGPNALERKFDSLTTLKMSLARANSAKNQPEAKPARDWQAISSSPLPPPTTRVVSASTQSRWLPSTIASSEPPTQQTTTTVVTRTIQTLPSKPDATYRPVLTSVTADHKPPPTTARATLVDELNETRAAESISKFTTHLNDANELISTAKFRHQFPQIANTGDFFSAETIASWPEKYHTMISRAMEQDELIGQATSKMTTKAFETTRRNGESYDLNLSPQTATTLARHRLDNETTPSDLSIRPVVTLSNTPGITILPSNHKLDLMAWSTETIDESRQQADGQSMATLPMKQTTLAADQYQASTKLPSSVVAPSGTKRDPQLAPYTLIEQLFAVTQPVSLTSATAITNQTTFPTNSTANFLTRTSLRPANFSSPDSLRAPYQDNYDQFSSEFQLSEPALVLDRNQSRPHVSRKLYELLVPSTQNFVGSQNPLNMQRFNWSALKYLTQNILSSGRFFADNSTMMNSNLSEPLQTPQEFSIEDGQQQYATNRTLAQQNELLNRTNFAPPNYYELSPDDSSPSSASLWPWLKQEVDPTTNQQTNATAGKGLFERASNLLSEMKQNEQKRAAAILAAFRYQVPGPLVKPWDIASDVQASSGRAAFAPSSSISRFFIDRFDKPDGRHLGTGQLLNSLKSTLLKQRVVAREELMARLNRREMESRSSEPENSDWRLENSAENAEPPRRGVR